MSNWIDCYLEVLASSPKEINDIAERLTKPSEELAAWVAQRSDREVSDVSEDLKQLLAFKTEANLGCTDNALNKARSFSIAFRAKHIGIVQSHLFEVSEAFPAAIFLLECRDIQSSCAGRHVVRGGEVVQEVFDGNQRAQGLDWALLDIFAPFRTEYFGERTEFGGLWQPWLVAVTEVLKKLKEDQRLPSQRSTESYPEALYRAQPDVPSKRVCGDSATLPESS